MNPLNSPWNKPKKVFINDQKLYWHWLAISKHLTTQPNVIERNHYLQINDNIYIAKNSSKMRLKSHLDWCWYTAKTLAQAIDTNTVEEYYEVMLEDCRSDPNLWRDKDVELELKSFYAARANRASLI